MNDINASSIILRSSSLHLLVNRIGWYLNTQVISIFFEGVDQGNYKVFWFFINIFGQLYNYS